MARYSNQWRKRIFLLLLAVLPQIISLGGLAGVFWLVKIKEVFTAEVRYSPGESGSGQLKFELSAGDRPKIAVGGLLHGSMNPTYGSPGVTFRSKVLQIVPVKAPTGPPSWEVIATFQPDEDFKSSRAAKILASGQPLSARMGSRTRRALTVLFRREGVKPTGSAGIGNLISSET